jgi:hypothetical protein
MPAFFNAIHPAPVSAAFVTSNLIGYWDALPVNQGSPWPDLSPTYNNTGQTHNLNLANGAAFSTLGGVDCLYLDGVNDRATYTNASYGASDTFYISTLLAFTHEYWIRSNGAWINDGNIYSAAFNSGSRSRFDSSGNLWFYNVGSLFGGNLGGSWATNTWHHLCVTMESLGANDRFTVYKNGVQVGQDTTGNYAPTFAGPNFYLGTQDGSREFARIGYGLGRRYNRALTSTEVSQNFNAEKARFGY